MLGEIVSCTTLCASYLTPRWLKGAGEPELWTGFCSTTFASERRWQACKRSHVCSRCRVLASARASALICRMIIPALLPVYNIMSVCVKHCSVHVLSIRTGHGTYTRGRVGKSMLNNVRTVCCWMSGCFSVGFASCLC